MGPKPGERGVLVQRIKVGTGRSVAALIQLNRPEHLNAIDWELLRRLEGILRNCAKDPDIRTILITGRGRAFSAGGDLKSYRDLQTDPTRFPAFIDDFHRTMSSIRYIPKPVVALVNGVTAAGGLELMLACDFAWAARSAKIGDGHLNYGQMGGGGVLTLLPRLIGPSRARQLIFSARFLSAEEALDWGLVTEIFDDQALIAAGVEFAAGVATKSPAAIEAAKFVINAGLANGTGVDDGLRLERERSALYCLTLPDSMEGLNAFIAKRAPNWTGDQ